jgi:hypothetical protein
VTVLWLGVAVAAGLLSTLWPRARWHWVLGALSLAALVAGFLSVRSADGADWVVLMAAFASAVTNAIGLLMLLARRHARRPHRHIIYCGYGCVFTAVALLWALAGRQTVLAIAGSASVYVIGSVAIGLYKSRHTRAAHSQPDQL